VRTLAVLVGALITALAITGTAGAASVKRCGAVPGEGITPTRVTAHGTSCGKARRLADRVSKVTTAPFRGCVKVAAQQLKLVRPCHRLGYSCKTVKRIGFDDSGIRIRCQKHQARVGWDL
jgi:hypothetical protein